MAVIGTATLNVVPKISGLSDVVRSEFSKVRAETLGNQAGTQYSQGVSSGLAKSGAIIGAFSAITQKALSVVSNQVGAAISRFDTLNNYPRVMESLGYSAEAAESSITKMSDRLQTLPTTLDSMVSLTQGLVVTTGDLNKATDAALALNDMLLASGSNQQLVNSAQEQFRQILSKGKPDMQDWKSLTMAMPGQLDQLAKAMLGPTANANDLYAALGGGKNDPTISMDELLDAVIRLDKEGGEGFASFQSQAETARGGVSTSMANTANAITRGITSVMDTIGKENIAGVFNDIKGGINTVFGGINAVVSAVMPGLKGFYGVLKAIAPALITAGTGFAIFQKGAGAISSIIQGANERVMKYMVTCIKADKSTTMLGRTVARLGGGFNAAALGIGAAVTVISLVTNAFMDAQKKEENLTKATSGLNDAVARASSLSDFAGKIDNVGTSSSFSAKSVTELAESMSSSVDKMNEISDTAEKQIGVLNTAQATIQKYAGQTDLSTKAQGELEYALKQLNEQFGLSLTAADVAAGAYTDQNGDVQDLTTSIGKLIEEKKKEIELNALSEQLGEAYSAQAEASKTYASTLSSVNERQQALDASYASGVINALDYQRSQQLLNDELSNAESMYKSACNGVDAINEQIGDTAKSTSAAADAYDAWSAVVREKSPVFEQILQSNSQTFLNLKEDLTTLGADTEKLSTLEESELIKIANAYDGTAKSIAGVLGELGVSMKNVSAETLAMAGDITSALNDMDVATPLENAGVSVDGFSLKLADAGVSTEALKDIGSENLAALAESCGGNIDMMIAHIENYNATPLYDKNGMVSADDTTLIDALGNIYIWNGQNLVNKNGEAVVNQVDLEDAQGNLVTWNGTELQDKDGHAIVKGNMAESITTRNAWNNGDLFDKECTARINFIQTNTTQNAAGGYRLNAKGGIRYHADGFIATRATMLSPRDMVGEAGAEAIVPLTNRTYAQPFIDMLVDGLKGSESDNKSPELLSAIYTVLTAIYEIIPSFSPRDMDRYVRRQMNA